MRNQRKRFKKISLAIRFALKRYWRGVRVGKIYRRGYSEKRFKKFRRRRKTVKKSLPIRRRERKFRLRRGWMSIRDYLTLYRTDEQSISPELEMGIRYVLPGRRFGSKVQKVPRGRFYRNGIMNYFVVTEYAQGDESRSVLVGYAHYEHDRDKWISAYLGDWEYFANELGETALERFRERHPHWRFTSVKPVLWHFIKRRYKSKGVKYGGKKLRS